MTAFHICLGVAVALMGAGFVSAIYSLVKDSPRPLFFAYGLGILAGIVAAVGIVITVI